MKEFWLDLEQQLRLKQLRESLSEIHDKHIEFIKKQKDGTLRKEDMEEWRQQNIEHQKLNKEIKEILNTNPLLPENIAKVFKDWKP
ncbi:MAG: hypothetical protein ACPGJV_11655 [Bacteriovoracaceae bacterium]